MLVAVAALGGRDHRLRAHLDAVARAAAARRRRVRRPGQRRLPLHDPAGRDPGPPPRPAAGGVHRGGRRAAPAWATWSPAGWPRWPGRRSRWSAGAWPAWSGWARWRPACRVRAVRRPAPARLTAAPAPPGHPRRAAPPPRGTPPRGTHPRGTHAPGTPAPWHPPPPCACSPEPDHADMRTRLRPGPLSVASAARHTNACRCGRDPAPDTDPEGSPSSDTATRPVHPLDTAAARVKIGAWPVRASPSRAGPPCATPCSTPPTPGSWPPAGPRPGWPTWPPRSASAGRPSTTSSAPATGWSRRWSCARTAGSSTASRRRSPSTRTAPSTASPRR